MSWGDTFLISFQGTGNGTPQQMKDYQVNMEKHPQNGLSN